MKMTSARQWKIIVNKEMISGKRHRDFPLLVRIQDEGLRHTSHGGHVTTIDGSDLTFLGRSGRTTYDHEVRRYDPQTGLLEAFVRVPRLSSSAGAVMHLRCGPTDSGEQRKLPGVWNERYRLVIHHPADEPPADASRYRNAATARRALDQRRYVTVAAAKGLKSAPAITVEAWVETDDPRPDAMQAIVSKWAHPAAFGRFDAYDAGVTNGLETKGFFGGVFDGRYIYFAPQHDEHTRHGKALRYDTHGGFHDPASWEGYDAGHTDGLNTKGYYGATFDGRYVIYNPRRDPAGFHSRALRFDTHGRFADPASWSAYDVGIINSSQSAAFDGRYVYMCPGQKAVPKSPLDARIKDDSPKVTGMPDDQVLVSSGTVIRYDTQGPFKDQANWTTYDASGTAGLRTDDYDGAVCDGRYVYFAPLTYACPLRYDNRGDFHDPASWSAFDARPLGMKRCVGAIYDGRCVYYVPYGRNEVVARYDTRGEFTNPASWTAHSTVGTSGLKCRGYDGAIFDGRYVYFVPYWDEETLFHGHLLRYDTQGEFHDSASWQAVDAGMTRGLKTVSFNGGAFDGRFAYFVPWIDGTNFPGTLFGNGRVLRYDTVGKNASFSLRYMDCGHNGGLCAAMPGTRFLVNTAKGPVSVASNRIPAPGRHHLVGVYDGKAIRLHIDGELVNEQPGRGPMQTNDVDISIARFLEGAAQFDGRIEEVRISSRALSADWIKTQYLNHKSPADFSRVEPQGGLVTITRRDGTI